ncbi:MAG: sugar phosphate isomerase/epimerase [Desulfomonile tiedjei]|nr:sugar phosphate isomerase/epimerase [Desulfomonile tiedjei]
MRVGTTSYIYPADIITNVTRLSGKVRDVELVIFEANSDSDLPDEEAVAQLLRLASGHDMTYTVHLPLYLGLPANPESLETALKVVRVTKVLSPHAFIIHLDGSFKSGSKELDRWVEDSCGVLRAIGEELGALDLLCVENLDLQPPAMVSAVLDRLPVSCCVDVGHLWKQGLDALPCLEMWLPRCRVVHIHGVGRSDHKALSLMPEPVLDPVIKLLNDRFSGVLTLEVFGEKDFEDSLAAFRASIARLSHR